MEFWGLEVKPGQTVKCEPEDDHFLHLSQAALGESKKASDSTLMYVKVDDQKLAIGTLSAERFPQIQFDLVFDKGFELSHTSKTASVFFSGYKVYQPAEGDEMDFDSEEDEDEEEEKNIPVIKENGKAEGKGKEQKSQVKIDAAASKSKAVAKDVGKNKKDADDSDSDETDSDSDEGLSPEEGAEDETSEEDSSEDDEDESDEDDKEETPKKPETGKKRAAESALKTPASDKKAKVGTPSGQKTGARKGVHVATPHPAKQASKTPGNSEKSPKSGGSVVCKSCPKTFNSEMALQAHSKAKHGVK